MKRKKLILSNYQIIELLNYITLVIYIVILNASFVHVFLSFSFNVMLEVSNITFFITLSFQEIRRSCFHYARHVFDRFRHVSTCLTFRTTRTSPSLSLIRFDNRNCNVTRHCTIDIGGDQKFLDVIPFEVILFEVILLKVIYVLRNMYILYISFQNYILFIIYTLLFNLSRIKLFSFLCSFF